MEQSFVGNVLSSCAMWPPMVGSLSTRWTIDAVVCDIESCLDAGNPGPDDDNVIHGHIPRQSLT